MLRTFIVCLFVVFVSTVLARPGGRGGKGGGCKKKPSPCADQSMPLCPDGNKPDKDTRPPSCSDGGSPTCSDGSEPLSPDFSEAERNLQERQGERDDKDDEECDKDGTKAGAFGKGDKTLVFIIGASAGGSVLIISLLCCAYCWRRAAVLKSQQLPCKETAIGKAVEGCVNFQPNEGTQSTIVVGHPPNKTEHKHSNVTAVAASTNDADNCHAPPLSGESV